MAFKPFHFFRKRSKLFMAGLVLLAMFSFIVMDAIGARQGGGGGLAMRIKGWFGYVERPVGKVDGQGYDSQNLHQVLTQRRRAAEFVVQVNALGRRKVYEAAGFSQEDLATEERFRKKQEEVRKNNPAALKDVETTPASFAFQAVEPFLRNMQYAEIFRGQDLAQFGISDPLQPSELLEFVYWLKQADQLGIVMSADRVKQDLIRAGYSHVKEEDFTGLLRDRNINADMKINLDTDTVVKWVGDEIRVMMAKAVLLAPEGRGGSLLSAQVTPFDLWKAYVDIKTQLVVGVLPVQVNSKEFLDRVVLPDKGSAEWKQFVDAKLKPFFEEYKKQQPDPARDTPGFMVPKKYQIEFLYGDLRTNTDARKYYEQAALAEDSHQLIRDALSLVPIPLPKVQPERAVRTYKLNKLSGRYKLPDDLQSVMIAGVELGDGSRYQLPFPAGPGPFNTAPGVERQAAAQQLLDVASALTQSPLSSLGMSAALRPSPRKATRTIPQPQPTELAAALVSRGMGMNLGVLDLNPDLLAFCARLDYSEETRPFREVLDSVRDEMIEDQCRTLLQRDLQQLKKDLDEFGKKYRIEFDRWKRLKATAEGKGLPEPPFNAPPFVRKEGDKEIKEPVKDYLKRFAAARGLTYEGMKEPRGPFDLFTEKDATPLGSILRPVYVKSLPVTSNRKPDDEIRNALIGGKGLFDATQVQAPNAMSSVGLKPWEYVLHWKVVEFDAREPKFTEAEPQVLEAWKLKEARVFAEAQANTFAKQAKTDDGEKVLKDVASYQPEKMLGRYELAGNTYRRSNITYVDQPPADFIDQALDKLKSKGDTLIVANRPKSTYYLLVLKERNQPRAEDKASRSVFDQNIVMPDPRFGFRVDDQPFSTWVQRERSRLFQKNWEKFFRARTDYDEKEAAQALDSLRQAARN